jgi:ribonucleoside-diphosphate reductase beta chain
MADGQVSIPGLMTPSVSYKPFRYSWAHDFWKLQQQVHWLPEEVPLGEDCKDWVNKLNDRERNLLTQIFRFFTQSDVEVGANYMENYMPLFKPVEVRMMLASFSNMETVHIAAYALLLETIGMPDSEFSAFMEYEEMAAKHDYLGQFGTDSHEDILTSMAVFGGFTEGLQLFASFADELPAFQQNEGHGADRDLVHSGRKPSLRGHDEALPYLCRRDRRPDAAGEGPDSRVL